MDSEGALLGGRYRLDQALSRGRAGIVWLAYDTRLNRTVAAKQIYLPTDLAPVQAEQARSLALQQGREATKVLHDNVVTVHEVIRAGNQLWLVMEYLPSRTMSDFLAEHGALTPEQTAFLGVQLGAALSAIHAAGLAHRGLEPENVLLADDGGVKVTDVGISTPGLNLAYRAPEVAQGLPAGVASDAFSLGVTLYIAVEGALPFGEKGFGEDGSVAELRTPRLAGPLTGALLKLLRTNPRNRPTIADTSMALKAITQGSQTAFIPRTAPAMRPVSPTPRQVLPQPTAAAKRRPAMEVIRESPQVRVWIMTTLAIIAAVAIGIGISELFFV